jgi:hypothetical protein
MECGEKTTLCVDPTKGGKGGWFYIAMTLKIILYKLTVSEEWIKGKFPPTHLLSFKSV